MGEEGGGGETGGGGEGRAFSHLCCLELHYFAPIADDVAEFCRAVFDAAGDRVVRAGEEAFRLEVDVGVEVMRAIAHGARVAELLDHLSKEDAASVHVWHR